MWPKLVCLRMCGMSPACGAGIALSFGVHRRDVRVRNSPNEEYRRFASAVRTWEGRHQPLNADMQGAVALPVPNRSSDYQRRSEQREGQPCLSTSTTVTSASVTLESPSQVGKSKHPGADPGHVQEGRGEVSQGLASNVPSSPSGRHNAPVLGCARLPECAWKWGSSRRSTEECRDPANHTWPQEHPPPRQNISPPFSSGSWRDCPGSPASL